jgi:hypothetical protein
MAKDKLPKIIDAAKEQPLHTSKDTDSAVTGTIDGGKSRMMGMAGLPHKQGGEKMPHEHFQDKMTKGLC